MKNINISNLSKWKEFRQLEEKVIISFFEEIQTSQNQLEKDIISIGFRSFIDVCNCIYIQNSSIQNFNNEYFNIIKIKNKLNKIKYKSVIDYDLEKEKIFSDFRIFKLLKLFIKINMNRLKYIFKPTASVFIESINLEKLKIYDKYGLILPISITNFLNKSNEKNDAESLIGLSNRLADRILNNINSIQFDKKYVAKILYEHFRSIYNDYKKIKINTLPKNLIINCGNKTPLRLLCRVMKMNKKNVVSFAHGEILQNKDYHRLWLDNIISTNYVEQYSFLADDLKTKIKKTPFMNLFTSKIESLKNDIEFPKKGRLLFENKKVLLIGNATKLHSYSTVTSFIPSIQAEIELTILNFMKNKHSVVNYKAHPGGHVKTELIEFYKSKNFINIENEIFEKVIPHYDIIIFYYARTSTINAAFKSKKHLIFIDLGIEKYEVNSFNKIKDRCHIIKYEDIL
tara:strand:- start:5937 stop:7304 length:1368 start_codon:yes stop_codon:yes gene_type:complete